MSIIDALKGKTEELKDRATRATRAGADRAQHVVERAGGFAGGAGGNFSGHVGNARQAAHGLADRVGRNGAGPASA
ncbi:hypothetical protein NCCP1664_19910 [Zafaria cholistanensis]|uniref:Antitoxin n=1 Tax=Zafaria cholistanensis TaxID=1682741 RepID=A0A5A7NRV5_9MICC|nr:hypothetical protein [Zafaria cholistanensis]GER23495.1 hypothetical protein NCCP1664_19910 [Zafaria cholistanensis]